MVAMPLLRVATANVLHGVVLSSGSVDLDAHARALAALEADVIAVQEVDRGLSRSGAVDQVAALADRLGCHGVFAPALFGDPDEAWRASGAEDLGGPAYGLGLLSRHPLGDVARLVLPGGGDGRRGTARQAPTRRPPSPGWDREPRVALSAAIRVGGVRIRVATTHLSYLPWRGMRQLARMLRDMRGEGGFEVIAGDLNLPVLLVRAVAGRWTHAGGTPTYPSWRPRVQPDQLLAGPALAVERVVVGAGPGDHLPLVASLGRSA
jgi:endonuclease/exonuclease/phosphatase family metal-dependent hydrolase